MSRLDDRPAAASMTLRFLSGLLTVSILIQFFIAGMSSITQPEWWEYHKIWVSIFQWLVLPLPILAWFCGKPHSGRTLFASLPILQIALQYFLVHRALDGRLPIGVGLHAVNAALMLVVATLLTLDWHEGKGSVKNQKV
jgi:Family of unknown function (DUF6220)